MTDAVFQAKARALGFRLFVQMAVVVATLLPVAGAGLIIILTITLQAVSWLTAIAGLSAAAYGYVWWRWIRPLWTISNIECPCCQGRARIENTAGQYFLTCESCGRRADTSLRDGE